MFFLNFSVKIENNNCFFCRIPYFVPPNFSEMNDVVGDDFTRSGSNLAWRSPQRVVGGGGLSSMSSLDLLNANELLPSATLSGPNGNLDVRLKVGVTSSFYAFQRDHLANNVAHQFGRVVGGRVDSPSSSSCSSSKSYVNYENGRIPYVYTSADEFLVILDSQKAFEATAAVMTAKQAQQLADHYQKNSSPTNSSTYSNNVYNLSNSTTNFSSNVSGTATAAAPPSATSFSTTNGETNQTSRHAIPSPSPAVERVLLTSSTNRCNKKFEKLVEQDLIIRKNLQFLSS